MRRSPVTARQARSNNQRPGLSAWSQASPRRFASAPDRPSGLRACSARPRDAGARSPATWLGAFAGRLRTGRYLDASGETSSTVVEGCGMSSPRRAARQVTHRRPPHAAVSPLLAHYPEGRVSPIHRPRALLCLLKYRGNLPFPLPATPSLPGSGAEPAGTIVTPPISRVHRRVLRGLTLIGRDCRLSGSPPQRVASQPRNDILAIRSRPCLAALRQERHTYGDLRAGRRHPPGSRFRSPSGRAGRCHSSGRSCGPRGGRYFAVNPSSLTSPTWTSLIQCGRFGPGRGPGVGK